jgi:hypothetical protein
VQFVDPIAYLTNYQLTKQKKAFCSEIAYLFTIRAYLTVKLP